MKDRNVRKEKTEDHGSRKMEIGEQTGAQNKRTNWDSKTDRDEIMEHEVSYK